ncbi:hypothetical protein Tco_0284778 [Tanacetum coccineum]
MTDSIQLYDVKVVVRSTLKLLLEIKCLLSSNPNRLNLFRRTVFGPWLDLPSHYNDNHLMHYVLQHQIWILESYLNSKQWWSKKDNVISRCLAWTNITKFDKSHYNRLFGHDCILIVNLVLTPAEKIQAWFKSSIPFFNGIVDDDWKGCGDDSILVSKDNSVDEDYNVCEDASASLSKDEILNDKNNDQVLLEDGDGLFDSEAGCRDSEEDNENQLANVSIRDLYAMIKVHEQRIANL